MFCTYILPAPKWGRCRCNNPALKPGRHRHGLSFTQCSVQDRCQANRGFAQLSGRVFFGLGTAEIAPGECLRAEHCREYCGQSEDGFSQAVK
jgi:hypothetical protein